MKDFRSYAVLVLLPLLILCIPREVSSQERWAAVIPTEEATSILKSCGEGSEAFTTLGNDTVILCGSTFIEALKKKQFNFQSFPFRKAEEAYLMTTKDPALRNIIFPGVRTIWKKNGFRVLLADETAKMGLASKLSDFTRVDPLPQNCVVLTQPCSPQKEKPPKEDYIETMLKRLDNMAFQADIRALADLKTRYTYSTGAVKAVEYCEKIFQSLGMKTRRLPFGSSSMPRENLEAFYPGFDSANAGEVVIIGHLDSTSPQTSTLAPGADDNGSGAAGVLALARFINGLKCRADVRFLEVLGEEQGILGSKAYVASLKPEELAKIRGVINMDMIGFDNTPPLSFMIETASFNRQMAEQFTDVARKYTSMTSQISYNPWGSDHMPFLKKEIPAVLTIESEFDDNPTYHQVTDTPDRVNLDLCAQMLRLNAAVLCEMASAERSAIH